jgi:hypothetical protein
MTMATVPTHSRVPIGAPGVPYESPSPAGTGEPVPPYGGQEEPTDTSATQGAKEAAERTAEQVKERGAAVAAEGKEFVAGQVEGVAVALRRTAEGLRDEGQGPFAKYAERLADGIGRISSSLREQDFRGLYRKAEDFARREPALFIGGALALGFVAARFLKSGPRADEDWPTR